MSTTAHLFHCNESVEKTFQKERLVFYSFPFLLKNCSTKKNPLKQFVPKSDELRTEVSEKTLDFEQTCRTSDICFAGYIHTYIHVSMYMHVFLCGSSVTHKHTRTHKLTVIYLLISNGHKQLRSIEHRLTFGRLSSERRTRLIGESLAVYTGRQSLKVLSKGEGEATNRCSTIRRRINNSYNNNNISNSNKTKTDDGPPR